MNRTVYALCLLVTLVAIAGCGGGDDTTAVDDSGLDGGGKSASVDEEMTAKSGPGRAAVYRADTSEHEEILFDEDGYALYRFSKDKGSKSTCYGACAKKWPPLLTEGQPVAFAVIPDKLDTTRRKDGTTQVTYFGYPLYNYVGDEDKPTGKTTGHDVKAFGGEWYALHKHGQDVEH